MSALPWLSPRSLALVAALSGALLGCREEATRSSEPTEPWQRPAPAASGAPSAGALVYDVADDAALELRLPAREATPELRLRKLGGAFQVDFERLPKTRGTVTFDLESLDVLGDDGRPDAERTRAAREWLELGAAVAPERRRTLSSGRFEVDSLDELSLTRVDPKAGRVEGDERVTRVRGVAVGRLVLRQLVVSHRVPIELELRLPSAKGAEAGSEGGAPKVLAKLRGGWSGPLAEHDVAPRDEAGRPRPAERAAIGRVIGRNARVGGEIALVPRLR